MIFAKKDEVIDIDPSSRVADLTKAMSKAGFGARRIGEAVEILHKMTEDEDCYKFLGISGALVSCGLRKILSRMISEKYTDCVVSTGANITHDLAIAFGGKHYRLNPEAISDVALRRQGFFRIYDLCVPERDFITLESELTKILRELPDGSYGTYELIRELGRKIQDKNSIVENASRMEVPVIIPAFTDSILGFQTWSLSQTRKIRIDAFKDLSFLVNLQFDLKASKRRSGAIFLGGGVPKNFILQSALVADKPFDYVIQIVTDRPEYGGLSGATLQEAKSWGKVQGAARTCTVNCDVSIALPLIISSLVKVT